MAKNEIISPYFENGVFAGVRVTLGDEDFVIARKDYQNGKEMTWQEAMEALKVDGLDTRNYRQIFLTMAYRKEIDKVLNENGGDNLENCYWTCTECIEDSHHIFWYDGHFGVLDFMPNNDTYCVRAIKNLKK